MKKSTIASLLIIATSIVIAAVLFPSMPDKVASHWNGQGEVNGYLSKFWGLFLMPIVSIVIFIFFLIIPKLEPLKENLKQFRKYFDRFTVLIELFLFYIFCLIVSWNLGVQFNMTVALAPALAILFYYSGELISKTKRNYFIGVRTPWTLQSDENWDKTNVLGGKIFKVAGGLFLLGLFFRGATFLIIVGTVIAAFIFLLIYSYILWRKTNVDHQQL